MKKFIFILITFQIFLSCEFLKGQSAPINDYISSLALKDYDSIIIVKEKINNNITIDLFKGQIYFEPTTMKYERNEGVVKPLFDEKSWKKMKYKYENVYIKDRWIKGNYWSVDDFNHKKIIFIDRDKFPDPGKYELFNFKGDFKVFSFSNPIYYKHNKYATFSIVSTTTNNKFIDDIYIVVMLKKNGKWVAIEKVGDGIY